MATIEQIDDLYRFAKGMPADEREALSVDELYDRWRTQAVFDEDVRAIQDSLDDYNRGERGEPIDQFLSRVRAERTAGGEL